MGRQEFLLVGVLTEGTHATVTATASPTDQDDRPLAYEIDWGDGSPLDAGQARVGVPFSLGHTYPSQGAYVVGLRVGDELGQEAPSVRLGSSVHSVPI